MSIKQARKELEKGAQLLIAQLKDDEDESSSLSGSDGLVFFSHDEAKLAKR